MRLPAKRHGGMVRMYDARAALAGAQAAQHAAQAHHYAGLAQAARDDANARRLASAVSEEAGLTREAFFDRLRTVAVARAHVAETLLHARTQDELAERCNEEECAARARVVLAQRKGRKLSRWLDTLKRQERTRQARRSDAQTQEDYAWR